MHGKWSKADVPHASWTCDDIEDLGEPSEVCEMCEKTEIRFVHIMSHPDYPETLRCGCVCAGHMEGSLSRAKAREADMRKRAARRKRFASRKWKTSQKGNHYWKHGGRLAIVYRKHGRFGFRVENERRTVWGPQLYPTEIEAKLAAFDAIDGG